MFKRNSMGDVMMCKKCMKWTGWLESMLSDIQWAPAFTSWALKQPHSTKIDKTIRINCVCINTVCTCTLVPIVWKVNKFVQSRTHCKCHIVSPVKAKFVFTLNAMEILVADAATHHSHITSHYILRVCGCAAISVILISIDVFHTGTPLIRWIICFIFDTHFNSNERRTNLPRIHHQLVLILFILFTQRKRM